MRLHRVPAARRAARFGFVPGAAHQGGRAGERNARRRARHDGHGHRRNRHVPAGTRFETTEAEGGTIMSIWQFLLLAMLLPLAISLLMELVDLFR